MYNYFRCMPHRPELFILLLLLCTGNLQAQQFSAVEYPLNYFGAPLDIPVSLAGNFGDLRTNHYHMGLDYRTRQQENLPVYAVADGYVSRIKIEPYGYGRAIYITHPNGFTSLYAHLNDFFPLLDNYVRRKQYENESWRTDMVLTPEQFPVKKGQWIALSGNTGGSEGPHLHFELRTTGNSHNINPMLIMPGIYDRVPPAIYRLALYNRNGSVYEYSPQTFKPQPVKKRAGNYSFPKPLKVPAGKFSFGVSTEDKTNESFWFGIYQAEIYLDSILQCAYRLNDFIYEDSRYINAGIDYYTKYNGGPYIHHLSKLPGNQLAFFAMDGKDGVMQLSDNDTHHIMIKIKDVLLNESTLNVDIVLDSATIFPANFSVPETAVLNPNAKNKFENSGVQFLSGEKAVYDTVKLRYSRRSGPSPYLSALHQLGDFRIPMHDSSVVRIKSNTVMNNDLRQRTIMVLQSGRKTDAQKGSWNGDWMECRWRDFGQFYLWYDGVAPILRPLNINDSAIFKNDRRISFSASDETSDIAACTATLDGKWIMFRQKNNTYTYDFNELATDGWHTIIVSVTDVAGNETKQQYVFCVGDPPQQEPAAPAQSLKEN